MHGRTLSSKLIRNVLFGGLRSILIAPIPFLLTPLILAKIGAAGYGTWAIFLAINGMTSLTDLGLVGTLGKFVAEHYAKRDYVGLNRVMNTGLAVFGALSLLLSGLLWVGAHFVTTTLFRGSVMDRPELIVLFRRFLVVVAANILILLFSSVTTGLQRLDLTNMMSGFNTVFAASLSAVLLLIGWGLRGLLYGQIAAVLLTLLGYVVLVRRLLPQIRFRLMQAKASEAKRIFNFSLRLYFTQAAVAVHNNIEKLLLAMFVGVAAAGWYDIANDVALKIRGVMGIVLSPIMPAASELDALKDHRKLVELYYRTHKYLALVGIPAVCYVGAVSSRFVNLWIGPSFHVVAFPLAVLVLVHFFNLTSGPGFLIFAGQGNLAPGMRSALAGIMLNATLSLLLIYKFGFPGAVIGTSVAVMLATIYFHYLFHRETGNPVGRILRESIARPTLCALGILALLQAIHPLTESSWSRLVAETVLFGFLYIVAIFLSRFFDQYDWSKMEIVFPAMRRARRIIPLA